MRKIVPAVGFTGLLLAVLALGGALRVSGLGDRPMHTDEAVQAVKFGQLLEDGYYRYDPTEYHGPTLYYLTLLPARLAGVGTLADTGEILLRSVPLVFGLGLLLLLPLFREGLGKTGMLAAALLTAASPILVYYSRYYVQEALFVFFGMGVMASGWRYVVAMAPEGAEPPGSAGLSDSSRRSSDSPPLEVGAKTETQRRPHASEKGGLHRLAWPLLTGLFLGLMHATKETAVIAFAAWAAALAVPLLLHRRRVPWRALLLHGALAALVAVLVSSVFYSSFFTHARGPLDSFLTYFNFADRAGGQGHEKPWNYYLSILVWHRQAGFRSSEFVILALAAVGGVLAFAKKGAATHRILLGRFLAVYCLLLFAAYSVIPYKTPWLMMGFVHGTTLLAGVAVALLWDRWRHPAARLVLALAVLAGSADLARTAHAGSTRFGADDRNPYAYSHTSSDCLRLAARMEALAGLHPAGFGMTVKVIAEEYWPLPWYLRGFEHVGYWGEVPDDPAAPVVIASPALADEVEARLGDGYVADMAGLRPGVILVAYIREDLWQRLVGNLE